MNLAEQIANLLALARGGSIQEPEQKFKLFLDDEEMTLFKPTTIEEVAEKVAEIMEQNIPITIKVTDMEGYVLLKEVVEKKCDPNKYGDDVSVYEEGETPKKTLPKKLRIITKADGEITNESKATSKIVLQGFLDPTGYERYGLVLDIYDDIIQAIREILIKKYNNYTTEFSVDINNMTMSTKVSFFDIDEK